ncbi:hypothetical protein [Agromyces silvae]|uniref:hypothetical protein n=1 Tax=Agromyces silvae TaxID=3388266 RepID=UPI00280B77B1|nr:hypothetical protein [Agromyces protaetiae]
MPAPRRRRVASVFLRRDVSGALSAGADRRSGGVGFVAAASALVHGVSALVVSALVAEASVLVPGCAEPAPA